MTKRLFVAAIMLIGIHGCTDDDGVVDVDHSTLTGPCSTSDSRCAVDGTNRIERCSFWVQEDIHDGYQSNSTWGYKGNSMELCDEGTTCVDILEDDRPRAVCATSAEPDPRCADESASPCVDDQRLVCRGGYVTAVLPPCPDGLVCAMGSIACVLDPDPDPRCPTDTKKEERSLCDGQVLLTCNSGYLVDKLDCGAPELCFQLDIYAPHCRLSTSPDPRCADGGGSRCDGDVLVECIDRYAVKETECTGSCVQELARRARCR